MITIYTTPSCSSCRKAKKWFDDHRIEYREKNIFNIKLTRDDIVMMLKNTDNGFDDIISTRSKVFQEQNLDIEDMTMSGFIPRRLREIIMCTTCDNGSDCDYKNALNIYFRELQEKERIGVTQVN